MTERKELSEVERIAATARFREETEPIRQDNERKRQLGEPMHERLLNSAIVVGYGILGYCVIKSATGIAEHLVDYFSK